MRAPVQMRRDRRLREADRAAYRLRRRQAHLWGRSAPWWALACEATRAAYRRRRGLL